jgi:hypothetical protein
MGIKIVVRGILFAFILFAASGALCDTIVGSGGAAFQNWVTADLNENGSPYWDQKSMDGSDLNIGYCLTDASTAHLAGAPGAVPFWGKAYNSPADKGGSADPNFFFQRTVVSSTVSLKLEIAGLSNVNQFGWYDITEPSVLNPLFVGQDSAPASTVFSPSVQYGFYLKTAGGTTFYTQSSLNQCSETTHQHFAVFQESAISKNEIYWLGLEDLTTDALAHEGYVGDYNDMVIRLCPLSPPNEIPEPSTIVLTLGGLLLTGWRLRRSSTS